MKEIYLITHLVKRYNDVVANFPIFAVNDEETAKKECIRLQKETLLKNTEKEEWSYIYQKIKLIEI